MNSVIREGNGVSRATRGGDQALGSLLYANEKSARVVQGSCIEKEMKLLERRQDRPSQPY